MKPSKISIVAMIGIALLILIQILYDPISSGKHSLTASSVRNQLSQARAKWESPEIMDYTFEISGDARSICQPFARIEVKNEIVVNVETLHGSTPQILPPDKWIDPDWGNEVFLCNYKNFTMTRIFTLLDNTLQNFPASILQADFDSTYGFITSFEYGIYAGYGFARPKISNCCNVFRIKNFQIND